MWQVELVDHTLNLHVHSVSDLVFSMNGHHYEIFLYWAQFRLVNISFISAISLLACKSMQQK